jgi:hypothetical protein
MSKDINHPPIMENDQQDSRYFHSGVIEEIKIITISLQFDFYTSHYGFLNPTSNQAFFWREKNHLQFSAYQK